MGNSAKTYDIVYCLNKDSDRSADLWRRLCCFLPGCVSIKSKEIGPF